MRFYIVKPVTKEDDGGGRRKNNSGTMYLEKVDSDIDTLTQLKESGEIIDFFPMSEYTYSINVDDAVTEEITLDSIYTYLENNKDEWEINELL